MRLLSKTREHITEAVAQPTKNAMMFSLCALAIALVALMLAGMAVSR